MIHFYAYSLTLVVEKSKVRIPRCAVRDEREKKGGGKGGEKKAKEGEEEKKGEKG